MKRTLAALALCVAVASAASAQQPHPMPEHGRPGPGPGAPGMQSHDMMMDFLFPPEMLMEHQGEIGLSDAQRTTISQAIQLAQTKTTDAQWKLSAEVEKLHKQLQAPKVDETQALEAVDRVLALEREIKRSHMQLMVKIKNTLTPEQQDKLKALHEKHMKEHMRKPEHEGEGNPIF